MSSDIAIVIQSVRDRLDQHILLPLQTLQRQLTQPTTTIHFIRGMEGQRREQRLEQTLAVIIALQTECHRWEELAKQTESTFSAASSKAFNG